MLVTECALGQEKMTADEAQNCANLADNSLSQLRAVAGLCNAGQFDAATHHLPLHERTIYGDATDQAILRFSESLGEVSELRRCWGVKYELAFNSKNKFMIKAFNLRHPDGLSLALPLHVSAIFEPTDMQVTPPCSNLDRQLTVAVF